MKVCSMNLDLKWLKRSAATPLENLGNTMTPRAVGLLLARSVSAVSVECIFKQHCTLPTKPVAPVISTFFPS